VKISDGARSAALALNNATVVNAIGTDRHKMPPPAEHIFSGFADLDCGRRAFADHFASIAVNALWAATRRQDQNDRVSHVYFDYRSDIRFIDFGTPSIYLQFYSINYRLTI